MDTSKIASWGSREDEPERDAMRARLIGRGFMVMYRAAEGGKKKHKDRLWCDWIKEHSPTALAWMWSSDRAFKDEHGEAYAQVAGDLILSATAKGTVFSHPWFRTDIDKDFGWLFEPACLRHDGWELVDLKSSDGEVHKSWTKASD